MDRGSEDFPWGFFYLNITGNYSPFVIFMEKSRGESFFTSHEDAPGPFNEKL